MIDIKDKKQCVGCGACVDVCTQQAISWNIDNEGFWYPVVNDALCTDCKLCEKVCPVINAEKLNKINEGLIPKVFATYHKDAEVRFVSTTGGLFSALAEQVLDKGGYIGGAVWTEGFQAKHILSNNPCDLKLIRGSKYLQSDTTGIYKEIRSLLRQGEKVLVCGTPCSMAALRGFLGKDYDNLIIIDFVCCCINSPKLFQKYIQSLEEQFGGKMLTYHPKNKEYGGWHNFAFKATFDNGRIYAKNKTDDDYTRCFIGTHVAGRPSCFDCKFKKIPRVADITIGDFWGIENVDREFDSPNGVSLCIINNEKGKFLFEKAASRLEYREKTLEEAAAGNGNLYNSAKEIITDREGFYSMLDNEGFDIAIKRYCPNMNPSKSRRVISIAKQTIKKIIRR